MQSIYKFPGIFESGSTPFPYFEKTRILKSVKKRGGGEKFHILQYFGFI